MGRAESRPQGPHAQNRLPPPPRSAPASKTAEGATAAQVTALGRAVVLVAAGTLRQRGARSEATAAGPPVSTCCSRGGSWRTCVRAGTLSPRTGPRAQRTPRKYCGARAQVPLASNHRPQPARGTGTRVTAGRRRLERGTRVAGSRAADTPSGTGRGTQRRGGHTACAHRARRRPAA